MRLRNWKYKAALQRAFSAVPNGHRANFVFQRLTGGLPLSDEKLRASADLVREHIEGLEPLIDVPLHQATFFEFGAGWDLHIPILFASMGVKRQFIVDIRSLIQPQLVFDIGDRVAALPGSSNAVRRRGGEGLTGYLERLGIHYRAPRDARATGIPDATIDCVTSTNTLEHIPPEDIAEILDECRRILRPSGAMSFQVDFNDHWAYFDSTIGRFSFLTFDEDTWRRYNPALHFQNRLRRPQFIDLYQNAGFEICRETLVGGDADDIAEVSALDLAPPFAEMDPAAVAVRGHVVLLRGT